MITKFRHIKDFAVFKNFDWDNSVKDSGGNVSTFKKLNIIYGRNYSGKTSLSRIVRSLETAKKPEKYENSYYEFSHSEDTKLSSNNLTPPPYSVRVYNKDFVEENLKWLSNPDGSIKSFAVLGDKNIALEKEVEKRELQIGSIANKTGLAWELSSNKLKLQEKHNIIKSLNSELDKKLTEKASSHFKKNPIYRNPNYNISTLKADIESIKKNGATAVNEEEKIKLIKTLSDSPRATISFSYKFSSKLTSYQNATADLLSRPIRPTLEIHELADDSSLEDWVRSGMDHHHEKANCNFCGGELTAKIWKRLKDHFNKDSEDLRELITTAISTLQNEKSVFNNLTIPSHSDFYLSLQAQYSILEKKIESETEMYIADIDYLINELELRLHKIFTARTLKLFDRPKYNISSTIDEIQKLVKQHNNTNETLSKDQDHAIKALRLSEVSSFIKDINFHEKKAEVETINSEANKLNNRISEITKLLIQISKEIANLSNQLNDERKGASRVNYYLKNHFGHETLQLIPKEAPETKAITFEVTRSGEPAHNLSEGECSLVAFCYFIAKLEEVKNNGKELVIWIDDPISSLDGNHIYFIYSLIESAIAKPEKDDTSGAKTFKYCQLFIATHNLDFLKYLKRISKPGKSGSNCEFFLIDRSGPSSKIGLMPNYLKKYITEFNYLFCQIHKCANPTEGSENHETFYNFGNNLRKFLEAYLYYKYPNGKKNDEKLLQFFGGNNLHTDLTNRINNELSHLEEIFDRSMSPLEIPEIPKLAKFVLQTIEQKDPEQYAALLESIRD